MLAKNLLFGVTQWAEAHKADLRVLTSYILFLIKLIGWNGNYSVV